MHRLAVLKSPLRLATTLAASVMLLGLLSNHLSTSGCAEKTRRKVEARVAGMEGGNRPITWVPPSQLIDDTFPPRTLAFLKPPSLMPGRKTDYPWAYVEPLPWAVPFVVRIARGFATNGQAGGTCVVYYLAFFGWSSEGREFWGSSF